MPLLRQGLLNFSPSNLLVLAQIAFPGMVIDGRVNFPVIGEELFLLCFLQFYDYPLTGKKALSILRALFGKRNHS